MHIRTVYASSAASLTSDVRNGGGNDDTAAIQKLLDIALTEGGVHLIMDGAALVSSLKVHSNTIIECEGYDCGFFQISGSSCAVVTNSEWNNTEISQRNITLIGGTYNQDCKRQLHHVDSKTEEYKGCGYTKMVYGMEFYGVEFLTLKDLKIRNFRTYACAVGCFKNVYIENVWTQLPDKMTANNQDGFHFWGPGQFLTVKNVGGDVGDDFMNIGPDERDLVSSISDVLVDGVFLDKADQAIRLLTKYKGRLDRVTIRNVSGVYSAFGFYINPWFAEEYNGSMGNILIENVDLRCIAPCYNYRTPVLFCVGGNIESIAFKNIRSHLPYDNRPLFELGLLHNSFENKYGRVRPRFLSALIDGLSVIECGESKNTDYIRIFDEIKNLTIKNVSVIKDENNGGNLVKFENGGTVKTLILNDVYVKGIAAVISDGHKSEKTLINNVNII